MAVEYLRSLTVPKGMQANRVENKVAAGVSVIGKDAPIAVQMEQPDGTFKSESAVQPVPAPDITVVSDLPPDAGAVLTTPDYQPNENGVGAAADAVAPGRVQSFGIVQTQPAAPKAPTMQAPPPSVTRVVPAGAPVQQRQLPPARPPQAAPVAVYAAVETPKPKVRVKLSNRGMGKVTVSVRAVSISETCVILAYPKDAENIVEPPLCGSDAPITVEYDANSYKCVFGGWTADLEDMFLVVMIKVDETAKA